MFCKILDKGLEEEELVRKPNRAREYSLIAALSLALNEDRKTLESKFYEALENNEVLHSLLLNFGVFIIL